MGDLIGFARALLIDTCEREDVPEKPSRELCE